MPRLLEKDDVMQAAVNLGRAEKVWFEQLVTGSGDNWIASNGEERHQEMDWIGPDAFLLVAI